jgi:hypothetical protein
MPVVLVALFALSGCRSDQSARTGLSGMSPTRWFAGDEPSDEFVLKPVPEGPYEPPPVPPAEPAGRAFVPAGADADPGSFYGIRPTGAEADAAGASWADRFRSFFGRQPAEPAPLKPVPDRRSAAHRRVPPGPLPEIRSRAVFLNPPLGEPAGPAAELARHIEPIRGGVPQRADRLPTIEPRFPAALQVSRVELPRWPYRVLSQPLLAARETEASEGPLLLH